MTSTSDASDTPASGTTLPHDELDAKMKALATTDEPAASTEATNVVENVDAARFELHRDGEVVSFATYRPSPAIEGAPSANIVVPHVETSPQHRGNGYAAELMDGLLALLRDSSRTITPVCPFAAGHIRDNPRHHDLLAG